MSWLVSIPDRIAALVLGLFNVPSIYQTQAPIPSVVLLFFLLAMSWILFRGYRARIVGTHRPWHLVGYVLLFLMVDHMVNLYCFLSLEMPIECPMASSQLGWFLPFVIDSTTLLGFQILFVDWVLVSVALRFMGCRLAWSVGARIAVFSLPATLILALPGADSWRAALVAWVVAQLFTLWRLTAERKF